MSDYIVYTVTVIFNLKSNISFLIDLNLQIINWIYKSYEVERV